MEASCRVPAMLLAILATLSSSLLAAGLDDRNIVNISAGTEKASHDLSVPKSNPSKMIKELLALMTTSGIKHQTPETGTGLNLTNLLNPENMALINETLKNLLRLGNESNLIGNLTDFAQAMNRTGRQFGGGFGRGGIDPVLLALLLKDDHGGRGGGGGGWGGPPPWYWAQNQQQGGGGSSSTQDLGQMALITLLGLALIGRMPTQG